MRYRSRFMGSKRNRKNATGFRGFLAKSSGWILFTVMLLYYELVFHGINFEPGDGDVLVILAFAVCGGGVYGTVTGLFAPVVNRIIATVLTLFTGVLFVAQNVYHSVFNNYLSVAGTIRFGNQAADNADTVLTNIREQALDTALLAAPMLVAIVCIWTFMSFERRRWWVNLACAGGTLVVYVFAIMTLWALDSDIYSPYKVYRNYTSVDLSVQKLGVMESFAVDVREGLLGDRKSDAGIQFESSGDIAGKAETVTEAGTGSLPEAQTETGTEMGTGAGVRDRTESAAAEATTEEEVVIDTSPNVLEIDFGRLNEFAGSDAVASLSSYFESLSPTNKNEYTGMFEGFNFIWITAEGFSGYALESGLYPTLEKLADEGFVFENYYQPLWYGSTLGGEYANLMGSPTKNGGYLSMCRAAKNGNGMTFSMGNTLSRLGYSCYAFHDNDYTYYDRNITHPALGYEWIASGSGLEYQTDENGNDIWPQSDAVMLEETFDKYTEDEPFHLYYLTVSGHVPYVFGGGNTMSTKNRELVENLNYSDTTKAYLASQYELETMLSELMDMLEKKSLTDNTVIVLAGDHVPYDNMEVLDELAGRELEVEFEAYESTLVIWSGAMEKPVRVDKVCSSIDILPTMLNLMGAEYDSRLIIGRDILSDSQGLVLFADRSFITDDYSYNANTEAIVSRDSVEVDGAALEAMKLYVSDKFTAADSITETGYYGYVAKCMGWDGSEGD